MLDALRRGAGTWVAKIFLGLLILSFAIWGVSDFLRGPTAHAVAKVGETEVSAAHFNRTYRLYVQNMSQFMRRTITPQDAMSLRFPDTVLSALVHEATLNNASKFMGLAISDDAIAKALAADERFQSSGRFHREQFRQYLQAIGISEDDFVIQLQNDKLREQILSGLLGGFGSPETYLQAQNQFDNEERTLRFVALKPESLGEIADPDATALQAYFNENKGEYRTPELRTATLLKLEPVDVMKPAEVTEAELKQEYTARQANYVVPEKRQIYQIAFPNKEEADAAKLKIDGGTSFEDVAAERKLQKADYDLGLQTRDKMVDPAISGAAFELGENKVSDVIKGRFRHVIIKVVKIEAGSQKTIADVEQDLRTTIAKRKAEKVVLKLYDEVEDIRAGGVPLKEVAEKLKLKLLALKEVDRLGRDKDGKSVVKLTNQSRVLDGIFKAETDSENDPVQVATPGFVWYEVTKVDAPRERNLDEVKDRAVSDWRTAQINKRLGEQATALVTALKSGGDLGQARRREEPDGGDLGEVQAQRRQQQTAAVGPNRRVRRAEGAMSARRPVPIRSVTSSSWRRSTCRPSWPDPGRSSSSTGRPRSK